MWAALKFYVFCGGLLVVVFFLRLIHLPYPLDNKVYRASVESAVLGALDSSHLNSTSTLQYELSVNMTFRNRHMRWGESFWHRDYAVTALYNGTMLGVPDKWASTDRWGDGPANLAWWTSAFRGTVTAYSSVAAELERERAAGTVHVRVTVSVTLVRKPTFMFIPMTKVFVFRTYDCWLWFSTPGPAAPSIFDGGSTQCWQAK